MVDLADRVEAANPWERNADRYAVPSSAVPMPRVAETRESRLTSAKRDGCLGVGSATICVRIDEAIARLSQAGHGQPRYITLTEPDMLALAQVAPTTEYRDYRLSIGAGSTVFGRSGRERVLKKVAHASGVGDRRGGELPRRARPGRA